MIQQETAAMQSLVRIGIAMFATRHMLVLTRGCLSGLVMLGIGAVSIAVHMLLTSLQQISRSASLNVNLES